MDTVGWLRRPGRVAGLWFVATFVFSIPALLLYDPVLNDSDYVLGEGADARISLGALLEVLLVISNIATAVVFFPVLRRVRESVALGYVALRIMESSLIATGLMSVMTVVTLRDDLSGTGGAGSPGGTDAGVDPATLGLVGQALVDLHDWTFLLGPQLCAGFGNGLLLGYLMHRSGLVPPRMAMIGLVGGPLAFLGGVFVLFGAFDDPSGPLFAFTALEIVWEAALAVYLTVNGYRQAAFRALTQPPATARG